MEVVENKKRCGFIKVRCHECSGEKVINGKASTKVICQKCNAVLAVPRGGKAAVKAEILELF